jgi:hypothetical protein
MTRILIAAVAIFIARSTSAADRIRIAFDIPEIIRAKASRALGFEGADLVPLSDKPDYTICARLRSTEDNGTGVRVWVVASSRCEVGRAGRGLSAQSPILDHCDTRGCKSAKPAADDVWPTVRNALNMLFVENDIGLGQYTVRQCTSRESAMWPGMYVESRIAWNLELGWRYRLFPKPPAYYYRVGTQHDKVVRFKGDSTDRNLAKLRTDHLETLCTNLKALGEIQFVTQIDSREPRSDFTAASARAMESVR